MAALLRYCVAEFEQTTIFHDFDPKLLLHEISPMPILLCYLFVIKWDYLLASFLGN